MDARRQLLRDALEPDDWKMSPVGEKLDRQVEPDSGLTSDEGPRGSTRGSPRPSAAGLKARRSNRLATSVVNLIRGSAAQPGMRPVAVVPSEVKSQFLLEPGEAVGNQDQPSRALGLKRSHASLDDRQASMLSERSEAMLDAPAPAPSSKSLLSELGALVGD